jgi:hypothetical protein
MYVKPFFHNSEKVKNIGVEISGVSQIEQKMLPIIVYVLEQTL